MRCIPITLVTVKKQEFVNIMNVCVSVLPYLFGMKMASFLCHVVLSSVTCLAIAYFSTSHEWHNLKKKKLLNRKCVS